MADRQGTKLWLAKEHGTLTYATANVGHWLSCVMLRPESNLCLVLYSYCPKLASTGDGTFFRHSDMNIEIYLKDG